MCDKGYAEVVPDEESSCPFALKRAISDCESSELVTNVINNAFYVDDLLASVKTIEEGHAVIRTCKGGWV